MGNWYAIRTAPGAQAPKREYAVEDAPNSRKGYRIVPSLDPEVSAVERALSNAGFHHYMPARRIPVRDRQKTRHWTTKRFPLLPGYVFVRDVTDWPTLCETPGVSGIVGVAGVPGLVPASAIATMQAVEADEREKVEAFLRQQKIDAERVSFAKARGRFPIKSRVRITGGAAQGREAIVMRGERDGRLRLIAEGLDKLGTISVKLDDVELLAAE